MASSRRAATARLTCSPTMSQAFERYLSLTEALVNDLARSGTRPMDSTDLMGRLAGHIEIQSAAFDGWQDEQERLPALGNTAERMSIISNLSRLSEEVCLVHRSQQLLEVAAQQRAAAAGPGLTGRLRETFYVASHLAVSHSCDTLNLPIRLLHKATETECAGSSLLTQLSNEAFLRSLAQAAVATPALLSQVTGPHMQPGGTLTMLTTQIHGTGAMVIRTAAAVLRCLLYGALGYVQAADKAAQGSSTHLLPPASLRILEALSRSHLLPAVCRALLEFPHPDRLPRAQPGSADTTPALMGAAILAASDALGCALTPLLDRLCLNTAGVSGLTPGRQEPLTSSLPTRPQLRKQAELLLDLLRSGGQDIVQLQEEMLERLVARGGAAKSGDGTNGGRGGGGCSRGGSGIGGGRGCCWALQLGQREMGRVAYTTGDVDVREVLDCDTVTGTIGLWSAGHRLARALAPPPEQQPQQQHGAASTSGAAVLPAPAPPPAEVAALAIRAARALYRLSHGEGRDGAYAEAKWQGPHAALALNSFGLALIHLPGLEPAALVRERLPDLLEAGAWALGWSVRVATASPLRPPPGRERELGLCGRPPLAAFVRRLEKMVVAHAHELESLSPAAYAECTGRLATAGLLRSLDALLRLACQEEEERARDPAVDEPSLPGALLCSALAVRHLISPLSSRGQQFDELGLIVTGSKRARLLTRRLEALPCGPPPASSAAAAAEWTERRGLHSQVQDLMHVFPGSLADLYLQLRARNAFSSTGPDPQCSSCVSVEQEAFALMLQSGCPLVASMMHRTARYTRVRAAAGALDGLHDAVTVAAVAFRGLFQNLTEAATASSRIPVPHLVACQPHRLIAAACELLPAVEEDEADVANGVAMGIVGLVVRFAAHPVISRLAAEWLARADGRDGTEGVRTEADSGDGSSSSGGIDGIDGGREGTGGGGSCNGSSPGMPAVRGCLRGVMEGMVPTLLRIEPKAAAAVLALLQLAEAVTQPPGAGGGEGGGGSAGCSETACSSASDGIRAFHSTALQLLDGDIGFKREVTMPDGTPVSALAAEARQRLGTATAAANAQPPLLAALPPPEPVPAADLVLSWLRLCSNPGCDNFAGASEKELKPKQCGGCRAVRYCRPECQRAHWGAGHKAECKQLQGK